MAYVPKTDWKNKGEPGAVPVYAEDANRWELGIAEAISIAQGVTYDVRAFGNWSAESDWEANRAALQAANDAAAAAGGGRIAIPPGVYEVAGVTQDSRVELYGPGATLKRPAGTGVDMIESRLRTTTGTIAQDSVTLSVESADGIEEGTVLAITGAGGVLDTQYTTLVAAVDASQTTLTLTSPAGFPSFGWLIVDDEAIQFTGLSGSTPTGVVRGSLGTTAAPHAADSVIGLARVHYAEVLSMSGTTLTLDSPAPFGVTGATVTFGAVAPKITSITIDGTRAQGAVSPMPIDWRMVKGGVVSDVLVTRGQSAVFLNRGCRDCTVDRVTGRDCSAPEIGIGAAFWLFQGCKRNRFTNITVNGDAWLGVYFDDRTTTATEWDGPNDDNRLDGFEISMKAYPYNPGVSVTASNRNKVLNGNISGSYVGVVIDDGAGQYQVSDSYTPPAAGNEVGQVTLDVLIPWTLQAPGNSVHDVTYSSAALSNGTNVGNNLVYASSVTPGGAPELRVLSPDGTQGAPGMAFASDPDTGFFKYGANAFAVSCGAVRPVVFLGTQVQLNDGVSIEPGATTGTRIGTVPTRKIGFWGKTPVVQPAANADTSGATLAELEGEVNELKALLRSIGLMAS